MQHVFSLVLSGTEIALATVHLDGARNISKRNRSLPVHGGQYGSGEGSVPYIGGGGGHA